MNNIPQTGMTAQTTSSEECEGAGGGTEWARRTYNGWIAGRTENAKIGFRPIGGKRAGAGAALIPLVLPSCPTESRYPAEAHTAGFEDVPPWAAAGDWR